jgi:carbon monoxide dehydrogenase subunit G
MTMNLKHEFRVPATVDETWAAFNHMELIASCFPGAALSSVDGHSFEGQVKMKLGPTTLSYQGRGRFEERHLGGRHTVITLTGEDERGKGTVEARVTSSFSEAGDLTVVRMVTQLGFTGQAAQLAPGVVQDASDRLVAQFADAVSDRFAAGLGAEALAADSDPSYSSDLGQPASSSSKTYTYNPPTPASQSDYEVLVKLAPLWARKFGPPLAGGLALLWLVRRIRRR